MTHDQLTILAILAATVAMFLWGRWRHDMVAAGALLACVLAGLVTPDEAFTGFGHPAVITVACVLVLSQGLQNSGAVDALTRIRLAVALAGVVFVALIGWRLVPVRKQAGVEGFESGAYITEVRVLEGSKAENLSLREIEAELSEVDAQIIGIVQREVRLIAANPGRRVHAGDILVIEAEADALTDVLSILGLKLAESVKPEEPAEVEADNAPATKEARKDKSDKSKKTAKDKENTDEDAADDADTATPPKTGDVVLTELAVLPGSALTGRSANDILLRTRYGVNLLALSREGRRSMKRLRSIALQSGDLLLMQGPPESIAEFAADNGCVPLAQRELRIPNKRKVWEASLIMLFAIGGAAFGLLPAAVSFAIGADAADRVVAVTPRAA